MSETGSTTRITRVGTVVLPVSAQDEALEFYVGTLGFEKRIDGSFGDGQRWIEVAPLGAATTIALVRRGSSAGIEVSFATENAEADHSAMVAEGVDADAELIRMEKECRRCSRSATTTATGFAWSSASSSKAGGNPTLKSCDQISVPRQNCFTLVRLRAPRAAT